MRFLQPFLGRASTTIAAKACLTTGVTLPRAQGKRLAGKGARGKPLVGSPLAAEQRCERPCWPRCRDWACDSRLPSPTAVSPKGNRCQGGELELDSGFFAGTHLHALAGRDRLTVA